MKRALSLFALLLVGIASASARCGGIIYGYLDDAGVYHAGDGAVLFVPGHACSDFDASHAADPAPICFFDDAGSPVPGTCQGWPSVPSGFAWNHAGCAGDVESCDGVPCADGGVDGGAHCYALEDTAVQTDCPSLDAVGDTFCSAYAQQFVVTGKAFGRCDYNAMGTRIVCNWQTSPDGAEVCPFNLMAVRGTDAAVVDQATGVGCRYPCEP